MSSFSTNPFLEAWSGPHALPPFSAIKTEHFKPAFLIAMPEQMAELQAIVSNPSPPDFENTIAAFDRSGQLFWKVQGLFDNLCSSDSPPELQAVELELASPLETHKNAKYMLSGLFERIDLVHQNRLNSNLTNEQVILVEKIHLDFVRNGARFDSAAKARYSQITEKLAELQIRFSQVH